MALRVLGHDVTRTHQTIVDLMEQIFAGALRSATCCATRAGLRGDERRRSRSPSSPGPPRTVRFRRHVSLARAEPRADRKSRLNTPRNVARVACSVTRTSSTVGLEEELPARDALYARGLPCKLTGPVEYRRNTASSPEGGWMTWSHNVRAPRTSERRRAEEARAAAFPRLP